MVVQKPTHKMKTVIKLMDQCLDSAQPCEGCEYIQYTDCVQRLMADGLYYLKMTLEKSGKQKTS